MFDIKPISEGGIGKGILFMVMALLVVVLAVVVINQTHNSARSIGLTTGNDSLQILLANGGTQSSGHGEMYVTSATAQNRSWMRFDGVNDYIDYGDEDEFSPFNYGNISSFSIWAYMQEDETQGEGADNRQYIFSKGAVENYEYELFRTNATGNNNVTFSALNSTGQAVNSLVLVNGYSVNQWYHFAVVLNGTDIIGYVDGSSIGSATLNALNYAGNTSLRVGARSTGYLHGGIDEFRVYNDTLSAAEVTEIYNARMLANASLPDDNLVLWISYDEASGTTSHDKSGFGFNGV